jgi:hypothetical protein
MGLSIVDARASQKLISIGETHSRHAVVAKAFTRLSGWLLSGVKTGALAAVSS